MVLFVSVAAGCPNLYWSEQPLGERPPVRCGPPSVALHPRLPDRTGPRIRDRKSATAAGTAGIRVGCVRTSPYPGFAWPTLVITNCRTLFPAKTTPGVVIRYLISSPRLTITASKRSSVN